MKHVAFLLIVLMVLIIQQPLVLGQGNGTETAVVISVTDGDTVWVRIGDQIFPLRYIGINTPESWEHCFNEAKQANASLVLGQKVTLVRDVSDTDRYNRLLRYVYVGDLFVNAELIRRGYAEAVEYPPDTAFADLFNQLEQEAIVANQNCYAMGVFDFGQSSALQTTSWQVTSSSRVNVRSCAAASCAVVATVAPGEIVQVLSTANDWHEIVLENGQRAYIAAWLTRQVQPAQTASGTTTQSTGQPTTWYVASNSRVNVRSCAATSCEVVTALAPGTAIQVLSTANNWHEIRLDNGQRAFIATWLTSRTRPVVRPASQSQPSTQSAASTTSASQPSTQSAAPSGPSYVCDCSKSCSAITSCDEAYFQLRCGCSARDGDGDGVPCESICPGG